LPVTSVRRDCPLTGEEGEDDAKSACPFDILGCTRATMGATAGRDAVRLSKSFKSILSSDSGLQLDHLKLESLVMAGQHTAVNTFSSLVLRLNVPGSYTNARLLKSIPSTYILLSKRSERTVHISRGNGRRVLVANNSPPGVTQTRGAHDSCGESCRKCATNNLEWMLGMVSIVTRGDLVVLKGKIRLREVSCVIVGLV
jgi:hypothetical protein